MQTLTVERLLAKLGFGSRKECRALVRMGFVELGGRSVEDPFEKLPALPETISVNGEDVPTFDTLYIMMNKPCGLECSHNPQSHDSVFSRFPERLLNMGLNCVGRLDADSSGLLLFSNQGNFIHKVESPKKGMLKKYVANLARPVEALQLEELKKGVLLRGENKMVSAKEIRALSEKEVEISIGEGIYHEVRRMFAAVGNHVDSLRRIAIGNIKLDAGLAPGDWRFLGKEEVASFI